RREPFANHRCVCHPGSLDGTGPRRNLPRRIRCLAISRDSVVFGRRLSTVTTSSSDDRTLTAVTNTQALINIYDTAGTLIGTITQPSTSALHVPVFDTTAADAAASTDSGPTGSVVNLLSETNNFVS